MFYDGIYNVVEYVIEDGVYNGDVLKCHFYEQEVSFFEGLQKGTRTDGRHNHLRAQVLDSTFENIYIYICRYMYIYISAGPFRGH